ncbi:hypothetical protein J437_LFUL018251 [Ladona fulva]|uniref:ZAD domain-containing protein n=1 Tax=Ladona fulva TaxID=123851 RepID=A0A8K0KQI6_LADFU|nr:hypothetical protein J437_LFUL018251 [Ladona fulva]
MSGFREIPEMRKCRLCFDNKRKLIDVFEGSGSLINVAKTITEILHYKVFKGDLFPPFVCADCLDQLYEFKAFKMKCDLRKQSYESLLGVPSDAFNSSCATMTSEICGIVGEMPVPVKLVEVSTGKEVFFHQEETALVEENMEKDPLSCEEEVEPPVVYIPQKVENVECEPYVEDDYADYEEVPYCGSDDLIIPAQMVEVVQNVGKAAKKPRKRKANGGKKGKAQNGKRKKVLKVAIGFSSAPPLELVLREENSSHVVTKKEQLAKNRRKPKKQKIKKRDQSTKPKKKEQVKDKGGVQGDVEEVPTRQDDGKDNGESPGEEIPVPPLLETSPVDQILDSSQSLVESVVKQKEKGELGETESERPGEADSSVPTEESAVQNAAVVPKKGRPKKKKLGRPRRTIEVDSELNVYLQSGVMRSIESCHLPSFVRQPYFEALVRKSQAEAARQKKRQYCREYNRRKIATETPEEREKRLAGMRAYMKKLTERRRREMKKVFCKSRN